MATMRELKSRINSVHSSQKITGAMKMISSARLRKAESKLAHSQPYREKLWEVYGHIMASGCDYESPLVQGRRVENVSLVIYASDDGLCGAFNLNLYRELARIVEEYKAKGVKEIVIYPVGKKIQHDVHRISGVRIVDVSPLFEGKDYPIATRKLTGSLTDLFLAGKTDRVDVVYTHYKNVGHQTVIYRRFLPVKVDRPEIAGKPEQKEETPWYIYEPDCKSVLQTIYPLILNALMYEAFLDNNTSEQAARILAMQTANDNANKLLGNLHLEYNKLRQQGITSELLDIAGGAVR